MDSVFKKAGDHRAQAVCAGQHSWAVTASQSKPSLRSSSTQHDTSKPNRAHLIDVKVLHQPVLQEVGEGPAAIAQLLHVLVAHAGSPLVTDDQGAAYPAAATGALSLLAVLLGADSGGAQTATGPASHMIAGGRPCRAADPAGCEPGQPPRSVYVRLPQLGRLADLAIRHRSSKHKLQDFTLSC